MDSFFMLNGEGALISAICNEPASLQKASSKLDAFIIVKVSKPPQPYNRLPKCYLQAVSWNGEVSNARKELATLNAITEISNKIADVSSVATYNTAEANSLQKRRYDLKKNTRFFDFNYPKKSISFDFREC